MRESAQCLGGVQLLFPLLARLPGAHAARIEARIGSVEGSSAVGSGSGGVGSGSGSVGSDGRGSDLRATPERLLVQLLNLVCQMLVGSTYDQHFMLRRHGFAIFVFLLRQLPPVLWTVEAVTACVSITSCFASAEALHHEAVWLLFGVPRLWVYTVRHGVRTDTGSESTRDLNRHGI